MRRVERKFIQPIAMSSQQGCPRLNFIADRATRASTRPKSALEKAISTGPNPNWPDIRYLAKTYRSTACQRAAYKNNDCCAPTGGLSNGPRAQRGLQRISEANLKHGRQTKDKLAAQRHAAEVGRRVRGELKRIERRIVDAGLMPDD
jgi:hypothetical protein